MKTIIVIMALLTASVLTQCGGTLEELAGALQPPEVADQPEIDPVMIERGAQIYLEQYCGTCHQLDLAETRGNFGPPHNDTGVVAAEYITLSTYNGSATTAEEYIRESILEPQVFYTPGYEATNHHMPSYAHLPGEDIDAMVQMLLSQGR